MRTAERNILAARPTDLSELTAVPAEEHSDHVAPDASCRQQRPVTWRRH